MTNKSGHFSFIAVGFKLLVLLLAAAAGIFAYRRFTTNKTIQDLLHENEKLQTAITNLSEETQIGYAKVLEQFQRDGRQYTRLLFVETDRSDPTRKVLQKQYEIEGDVVHFDALIVKFGNQIVKDGRRRSLYLWRRVYGENMSPQQGYAIETPGAEPQRYADLCAELSIRDRQMFWSHIWDLANTPEKLKELGVHAIYGSVVYHRLRPGLIYVFKISNTANLYPEIVPDL